MMNMRSVSWILWPVRLFKSEVQNGVVTIVRSHCHVSRVTCALQRYRPCESLSCQRWRVPAQSISQSTRRQFWGLDAAFNKVDEERVRLAGPDRTCAEWVLKNGGCIQWTTSSEPLKDFNLLPSTDFENYKLRMIDLSGTDVVAMGFAHLEHIKHLTTIRLHGCRRISDDSLTYLKHVEDTLTSLEVSLCPMITTKGLAELPMLKNLKHLTVFGLLEVKNLDSAIGSLKRDMPWCTISTDEP